MLCFAETRASKTKSLGARLAGNKGLRGACKWQAMQASECATKRMKEAGPEQQSDSRISDPPLRHE